jgi:hypothetical protein
MDEVIVGAADVPALVRERRCGALAATLLRPAASPPPRGASKGSWSIALRQQRPVRQRGKDRDRVTGFVTKHRFGNDLVTDYVLERTATPR